MTRPRTAATYAARIDRVLDHVRDHLDGDLGLDSLARVAHFSPYHFHRIFKAVTGETLNAFVRRTRVERADQDWLILRNGEAKIGLFEGMFPDNTLTFNPPDVRAVQRALKAAGIELAMEADESTAGPAAASLFDPDGNPILLDQH